MLSRKRSRVLRPLVLCGNLHVTTHHGGHGWPERDEPRMEHRHRQPRRHLVCGGNWVIVLRRHVPIGSRFGRSRCTRDCREWRSGAQSRLCGTGAAPSYGLPHVSTPPALAPRPPPSLPPPSPNAGCGRSACPPASSGSGGLSLQPFVHMVHEHLIDIGLIVQVLGRGRLRSDVRTPLPPAPSSAFADRKSVV